MICETCGQPAIIRLNGEDMCQVCHAEYWATQGVGACPVCGTATSNHIGGKPCTVSPPRTPRGLYDLPIFGWAWQGDAKQVER